MAHKIYFAHKDVEIQGYDGGNWSPAPAELLVEGQCLAGGEANSKNEDSEANARLHRVYQ